MSYRPRLCDWSGAVLIVVGGAPALLHGATADITVQPADLEMHRNLNVTPGQGPGMFVGSVRLRGGPGVEVIGGDGELLSAVDAAGADLRNRGYFFGKDTERAPLYAHGVALCSPAEDARQGFYGPQLALYFAPASPTVVIARVQLRATLLLGDASRRVVSLGTWPEAQGVHSDLPGAPQVEADRDGQLVVRIALTAAPAWRALWCEVGGKPLLGGSGKSDDTGGQLVVSRSGRVPPGAEIKCELTHIIGERHVKFTLGPWGFPDQVPNPASVRIAVELPDAP